MPQLQCLVWLKPRVGAIKSEILRKALRLKNCVEQARTGAQTSRGNVCTQPRVVNIMCRGLW